MRDSSALKYLSLSLAPMEQTYNRTVHKSQPHRARHPTRYGCTLLSVRMTLLAPIAPSHDLRVVNPHELRPDGRSLACHCCPLELRQSLPPPVIKSIDNCLRGSHQDDFYHRHRFARDSRITLCAGCHDKLPIPLYCSELSS